jgi:HEAT repeat protein
MSPKLLTPNLLSVAILVIHCAFFAPPPRAQEKSDLAKLSAQIKDKDAAVRQSAIEALGQLKDPAAIDLLISALNDDNQDLRSAAALALGQTGADKGVEPLAKMLQSQRLPFLKVTRRLS